MCEDQAVICEGVHVTLVGDAEAGSCNVRVVDLKCLIDVWAYDVCWQPCWIVLVATGSSEVKQ